MLHTCVLSHHAFRYMYVSIHITPYRSTYKVCTGRSCNASEEALLPFHIHTFILNPKRILNSAYWCMADGRKLKKKMLLEPPLFLKHYNINFETEKITLSSLHCTERKAFTWVACALFLVITRNVSSSRKLLKFL